MNNNLVQLLADKINRNEPAALVMITKTEGSSPRGVGSMMVIDEEACLLGGTIGGGAVGPVPGCLEGWT